MGFTHNEIRKQVELLFLYKGCTYSTVQIKKIFKISKSTYLRDTWLIQKHFIEKLDFNLWIIRGF